ncbi:VWA domain-containing protein [Micromonospora sp. KC207]|uniref:vWA domain-containing protein n=1 Tax=Micromonospora sp. KC207 TaxID=2530377 RepID=UPI00104A60ED|nr:VWA domain-containing protein [Micromonospora sp. KC207]TDC48819.1 VWA domain-containing protein [Micromonospora sp. KC207]
MSVAVSERKTYPVYILLDVSGSMRRSTPGSRSPQAAFTEMIPDLIMSLSDSPALSKAVWISVIAFGDRPELLCPMTSLDGPVLVRSPRDGRQTDYVAALRFLGERIAEDNRTIEAHGARLGHRVKVARPLVFFITDGAPYAEDRYQMPAEWMPYRDRLVAPPVEARIATVGLPDAHPRTLWEIATGRPDGRRNAFLAKPGAAGDGLARSVVEVVERSITLSVRAGEMIMDEPHGMRRVNG